MNKQFKMNKHDEAFILGVLAIRNKSNAYEIQRELTELSAEYWNHLRANHYEKLQKMT